MSVGAKQWERQARALSARVVAPQGRHGEDATDREVAVVALAADPEGVPCEFNAGGRRRRRRWAQTERGRLFGINAAGQAGEGDKAWPSLREARRRLGCFCALTVLVLVLVDRGAHEADGADLVVAEQVLRLVEQAGERRLLRVVGDDGNVLWQNTRREGVGAARQVVVGLGQEEQPARGRRTEQLNDRRSRSDQRLGDP